MLKQILEGIIKHRWKLIGVLVGFIFARWVINYGFFPAVFILLCIAVGYYIGKRLDDNDNFRDFLDKLLQYRNK